MQYYLKIRRPRLALFRRSHALCTRARMSPLAYPQSAKVPILVQIGLELKKFQSFSSSGPIPAPERISLKEEEEGKRRKKKKEYKTSTPAPPVWVVIESSAQHICFELDCDSVVLNGHIFCPYYCRPSQSPKDLCQNCLPSGFVGLRHVVDTAGVQRTPIVAAF